MNAIRTTTSASKILLIVAGSQFALFGGAFAGGHGDFNSKNINAQITSGPVVRDHTGTGPMPQTTPPQGHPHGQPCLYNCSGFKGIVRDHRTN